MKKLLILLLAASLLLAACGKKPAEPETTAVDNGTTAVDPTTAGDPANETATPGAEAQTTAAPGETEPEETTMEPEGRGDAGDTVPDAPVETPEDGWVQAEFRDRYPIGDGEYDSFDASVSDDPVEVVFFTETAVNAFRVLSIQISGYGDYGVEYTYENLRVQTVLLPERPLVVTLNFIGDTPNNGIAFEDPNGITHICSVELSGRDGSLVVSELSQFE